MTKGSLILVVEDEMVISMEIVATLKWFGYRIAGQVMTGEEAIHLGDGTLFGCEDAAPVGTAISDWLCLDDLRGFVQRVGDCALP